MGRRSPAFLSWISLRRSCFALLALEIAASRLYTERLALLKATIPMHISAYWRCGCPRSTRIIEAPGGFLHCGPRARAGEGRPAHMGRQGAVSVQGMPYMDIGRGATGPAISSLDDPLAHCHSTKARLSRETLSFR